MTFLAVLLLAAGAPYLAFQGDALSLRGAWNTLLSRTRGTDVATGSLLAETARLTSSTKSGDAASAPVGPLPEIVGPPIQDLREVVRLDVSPEWVTSRWSRVTTVLADINYLGLRVPLVTGSGVDDLAGALTYYFDKRHRLRRITFHGYTGREEKLVQLMTKHYGFFREPHLGAGLYVVRWNGQPTSVLRVVHVPVVRADEPHAQLSVMLEINRPDLQYELSPEAKALLKFDHHSRKW